MSVGDKKGQYTWGGHSHRRRSHSCNRGQEEVKGSRAVFGSVKQSRTLFKLSKSGQDVYMYILRLRIAHSVVKCVRSNSQGPVCGAVKWSSNKNDSQNFLTPIAAVTTVPMGVSGIICYLLNLSW